MKLKVVNNLDVEKQVISRFEEMKVPIIHLSMMQQIPSSEQEQLSEAIDRHERFDEKAGQSGRVQSGITELEGVIHL